MVAHSLIPPVMYRRFGITSKLRRLKEQRISFSIVSTVVELGALFLGINQFAPVRAETANDFLFYSSKCVTG